MRTVRMFLLAAVFTGVCVSGAAGLDVCPDFVKREICSADTSIIGGTRNSDDLPEGWFVFSMWHEYHVPLKGIWKSDVRSFEPAIIPGTENDNALYMNIDSSGEWIIYATLAEGQAVEMDPTLLSYTSYIISADGGQKVRVPITDGRMANFYPKSPNGPEIFFLHDEKTIKAMQAECVDGEWQFGETRTIVQLGGPKFFETGEISGNHMFTSVNRPGFLGHDPAYLTIPDNGMGTATDADFYHYSDLPAGAPFWGCNTIIHPDGEWCLWDIGNQGRIMAPFEFFGGVDYCCAPNSYNDELRMDHKGFAIGRFMEADDEPASIHSMVDDPQYAVSINWAPEALRAGRGTNAYWYADHTFWNWSNADEYVIGVEWCNANGCEPGQTPYYGVWLVQWETNKWSLLTPKGMRVWCPDAYFTNLTGTRLPRHVPQQGFRNGDVRKVRGAVYDVSGRTVAGPSAALQAGPARQRGVFIVTDGSARPRIFVNVK